MPLRRSLLRHRTVVAGIWGLLAAAPLPAQFVNRAAWLGIEREGIRRDFTQGAEYHLDRFSYVVLPPWWDPDLDPWANGIEYRFGSVTARDFTVEGGLDHTVDLGPGYRFRYHLLQGEHNDARFLRNAVALEHDLSPQVALFAQGEILAQKSDIDASFGAWLHRSPGFTLRAMVTAVDLAADKDDRVRHEVDPWAVQIAGTIGRPGGHRIFFDLAGQLPLRLRDETAAATFGMERWLGRAEARWCLGEHDWLVSAAELEWTAKELRPDAPGSPLQEDFSRDYQQVRIEWWRAVQPWTWSAGLVFTHQEEDGRRPFDPALDLAILRHEWMAVGRVQVPLAEQWDLEPQVFAAHVRLDDQRGEGEPTARVDSFEGKVSWNLRHRFANGAALAFVVALQLDEPKFGGGGAQFMARF